jgi:RNA polymerase sigma-70 factor (ECF subfamily)
MANQLHVHHPEPRSEWIQQIRTGDEGAFEHLFRTYAPGLCAFLSRYVESPATAEDIVQDLFLTLWRKRETIWIDGPVSTYLLRAAKNRALNHLRGSQVRERFRAAHLEQLDERSEEAELLAALDLQEAISHLPPRCRVIFTLNRQQGFSYREIADDLGVSVKTVDTQIQRAVKSLRAWMQRTQ